MTTNLEKFKTALMPVKATFIGESRGYEFNVAKGTIDAVDRIAAQFQAEIPGLRYTIAMGDKTVLTLFDPLYIKSQKAQLKYDDTIDTAFANNLVLTHTTSLSNWKKIQQQGTLLGRNNQEDTDNTLYTPGDDSDGNMVYCEVHYRGEVLPPDEPDRVTIVLDPKLLKRKDYYACQFWSYGPFFAKYQHKKYFGPEVRDLEGFDTIPKEEVIPSVNAFFKNLNYYVFFPIPMVNEVGFANEIPLKDHQIQVLHHSRWTLPLHYISVIARGAFRSLTSCFSTIR